MTIPYYEHSGRRTHLWRIRRKGYHKYLLSKGWVGHMGFMEKFIRRRHVVQTIAHEGLDYILCSFQLYDDFWAEITAKARKKEAEERRAQLKVVDEQNNEDKDSDSNYELTYLYVDVEALKSRGWTKTLIERSLGDPDRWFPVNHWANYTGKKAYRIARVMRVEASETFSQRYHESIKRRKLSSEQIAEFDNVRRSKKENLCLWVKSISEEQFRYASEWEELEDVLEICRSARVRGQ